METGFRDWKNALSKFEKHQVSKCHIAATSNEMVIPQCGNVISLINENEWANMEMNCCCFMGILDAIQYLACQGLPLQVDDEESSLIQFLKKRSKLFPELPRKQVNSTSHDI